MSAWASPHKMRDDIVAGLACAYALGCVVLYAVIARLI